MKIRPKKLIKGILLYAAFHITLNFVGKADGLGGIENRITLFLNFLPFELAGIIGGLVALTIGITMVYCFVSGLFNIGTSYLNVPGFEKWEE